MKELLKNFVGTLPASAFEEKLTNSKRPAPYLTTHSKRDSFTVEIPGRPGYVGRANVQFVINIFDIQTVEEAESKRTETITALEAQLAALYAKQEAAGEPVTA